MSESDAPNLTAYLVRMGPICDHHPDECPADCEGQVAWKANTELSALTAAAASARDECAKLRSALSSARAQIRYVYHRDKISDYAKDTLMETEREIDEALSPQRAAGSEA